MVALGVAGGVGASRAAGWRPTSRGRRERAGRLSAAGRRPRCAGGGAGLGRGRSWASARCGCGSGAGGGGGRGFAGVGADRPCACPLPGAARRGDAGDTETGCGGRGPLPRRNVPRHGPPSRGLGGGAAAPGGRPGGTGGGTNKGVSRRSGDHRFLGYGAGRQRRGRGAGPRSGGRWCAPRSAGKRRAEQAAG